MSPAISVEHLSKAYPSTSPAASLRAGRHGQVSTRLRRQPDAFTNDLKLWWAKVRGEPNPLLKIVEQDHGNRDGETIWVRVR